MTFLRFLGIILVCCLIGIASGFFVVSEGDLKLGHKIVGLSVGIIFFILMPVFIIYRYKSKDLSRFTFNSGKNKDDDWDDDKS